MFFGHNARTGFFASVRSNLRIFHSDEATRFRSRQIMRSTLHSILKTNSEVRLSAVQHAFALPFDHPHQTQERRVGEASIVSALQVSCKGESRYEIEQPIATYLIAL